MNEKTLTAALALPWNETQYPIGRIRRLGGAVPLPLALFRRSAGPVLTADQAIGRLGSPLLP